MEFFISDLSEYVYNIGHSTRVDITEVMRKHIIKNNPPKLVFRDIFWFI